MASRYVRKRSWQTAFYVIWRREMVIIERKNKNLIIIGTKRTYIYFHAWNGRSGIQLNILRNIEEKGLGSKMNLTITRYRIQYSMHAWWCSFLSYLLTFPVLVLSRCRHAKVYPWKKPRVTNKMCFSNNPSSLSCVSWSGSDSMMWVWFWIFIFQPPKMFCINIFNLKWDRVVAKDVVREENKHTCTCMKGKRKKMSSTKLAREKKLLA